MKTRRVDLADVFDDLSRLTVGGGWVWQGDGAASLAHEAPPGETQPALALDYKFAAESQVHAAINVPDVSFAAPFKSLELDVCGDASDNLIKVVLQDALGGFYEFTCGTLDWTGWRTLRVPPPAAIRRFDLDTVADPARVWTQMLRQEDPIEPPTPPLRLRQIKLVWNIDRTVALAQRQAGIPEEEVIRGTAKETSGRIFLRNLRAVLVRDELDGALMKAGTRYVGNLFEPGQEATVDVSVINGGGERLRGALALELEDFEQGVTRVPGGDVALLPGATKEFRIALPPQRPGWYQVTAVLTSGGATRRARTELGIAGAALTPESQNNRFFGINAHVDRDGSERSLKSMDLAMRLGCQVYRHGTRQKHVNADEGQFVWDTVERTRGYTRQFHVPVMMLLHGGAQWCGEAGGGGRWGGWRSRPEAFGKYVYEFVRRYGNEIRDWEIWNEPNLAGFWRGEPDPKRYAELLRAAYTAAKAANPNVRILGPGMSGPYSPLDRKGRDFQYLKAVFDNGGYECLDVLSFHPYTWTLPGYENGLPVTLDAIVELMKNYGPPKPLYMTEVGVQYPLAWSAFSIRRGAAYTMRFLLHCLAHPSVETVLWYELSQDAPVQSYDYAINDPRTQAVRSPAMAYRSLAAELGDVTTRETLYRDDGGATMCRAESPDGPGDMVPNPADAVFVYRFTGPRGPVVAAWSSKKGVRLDVRVNSGAAERVDIMGRRFPLAGGVLALTETPILLRGAMDVAIV